MIVVLGFFKALFDIDVMRRAIHQFRVRHQRGWLGQPGRIPKAGDFAPRLVARTGAAIEAVEGGRTEEERFHFMVLGSSFKVLGKSLADDLHHFAGLSAETFIIPADVREIFARVGFLKQPFQVVGSD